MSLSIALTGATGFIGARLLPALQSEGHRVRCLVRRRVDLPGAETVVGDLADPGALARFADGVDVVLHLAGAIKARDRAGFFAANAEGTRALATAAARAKRFVLLSSLAAREPQLSDYAASKRAGEEAVAAAFPGAWVALRPAAVYGPGDRETLDFFKALSRGIAPRLGLPTARIGLIHVDDVVSALLRALRPGGEGAAWELDDGVAEGHSWAEMIAAGEKAVGRRARLVPVPRAALVVAALAAQGLGLVTRQPQILCLGKVREIRHPDWSRSWSWWGTVEGWSPRVDLEAGFRSTVAWYRKAGWL